MKDRWSLFKELNAARPGLKLRLRRFYMRRTITDSRYKSGAKYQPTLNQESSNNYVLKQSDLMPEGLAVIRGLCFFVDTGNHIK